MTRVLLVEDDPDIREIATLALETLGRFEVEACGDADAAVAALRARPADVVLLDWMLPGTDGGALLARLRSDGLLGDAALAFVTARAAPADLGRMRGLGARDVIVKPFDPVALPRLVAALL